MVRSVESKLLKYGSKVIIHVPMRMVRDSAFPFLNNEDDENIVIDIKGRNLVIRKKGEEVKNDNKTDDGK
jgi:hypothetical protein